MKAFIKKTSSMYYQPSKLFSTLEKVVKMEVSMRTPYKTYFKNFNGFQRIYVGTIKGQLAIQSRTPPTVYLLPAGEIKFTQLTKGKGYEVSDSCSGEFVHSGGYVAIHSNNTVDINLIECIEKEKFAYDKVDSTVIVEGDSKYDKEAGVYATKKALRKK